MRRAWCLCHRMVEVGCLICGTNPEKHHYPRTRRYGVHVVPLCHEHHMAWHNGVKSVRDAVQAAAPLYFAVRGDLTWELWEECLAAGRRRLRLVKEE